MAFPSPSELFENFKTYLKALKPDFNRNDKRSDFNIRGRVVTGLLSGLYGDQERVDDDTYVASARIEALLRKGVDVELPQLAASFAKCPTVPFTGTPGSPIPAGTQLRYAPTGLLYQVFATVVIGGGGTVDGRIDCLTAGQIGNIIAPDTLTFLTPPSGVDGTVTLSTNVADGADIESTDAYRARLLSRQQVPPAGGTATDYRNYAFEADPAVRGVTINRWGRGLGTVDIFITSGTVDIDPAVTAGEAIVRLPSGTLITTVQDYISSKVPLTDCARVFAPEEGSVNVNVTVRLADGFTLSTIPLDALLNPLNLTVLELVQREVGRVLYKYAIGGRKLQGAGLSGFVVGSDIEAGLDLWLSAVPDEDGFYGKMRLLTDRQVLPLDGLNTNLAIDGNKLSSPGTIGVAVGT